MIHSCFSRRLRKARFNTSMLQEVWFQTIQNKKKEIWFAFISCQKLAMKGELTQYKSAPQTALTTWQVKHNNTALISTTPINYTATDARNNVRFQILLSIRLLKTKMHKNKEQCTTLDLVKWEVPLILDIHGLTWPSGTSNLRTALKSFIHSRPSKQHTHWKPDHLHVLYANFLTVL